jgi:alanine-synthesizing transaminase
MPYRPIPSSQRLNEVRYEIRGELAHRAIELEREGRSILKLNIGNPGVYGFEVPAHLRAALADNLTRSEAYCHQQGLTVAREAIVAQQLARGADGAHPDSVFVGNGVSELIDIALRGLLNLDDEVLLPSPDYPLWSASVILNDGRPVYYPCRPDNGFVPDPDEVERLITPRTRALVVINPNNPSGAVYPKDVLAELVAIAERHRLVLMCDEIYDGITYDGAAFVPAASLVRDTLCLTFGGLSKVHRACGWRVGWLSLSGDMKRAAEYRHALDLLSALRLCANVPGQWTIAPALEGPDTITPLTRPGGRLYETRRVVLDACAASELVDVVAPQGALYAFPSVRADVAGFDDHAFALELLETENVLIVPGSSFNVPYRNHFRITLLPDPATMCEVFIRLERALARAARRPGSCAQRHVA